MVAWLYDVGEVFVYGAIHPDGKSDNHNGLQRLAAITNSHMYEKPSVH